MAIDTYAPCPGGTGKKIKFCCADLVGDLEQLDRLIEGDQLAAALEHVERLSQKHPGRACLFATRGKLELAAKQFPAAAATARAFVEAFPENPLALGQSAVSEAIAGRMQEAAGLFDKARAAARSAAEDVSPELVRIAATLVQVAAQLGHVGFAQGIVEWLVDRGLGSAEERRMLAAFVGSSGVPPALRTKVRLVEAGEDSPWRAAFDAALGDARQWRLAKALAAFRGLKTEAGRSRALFTNVAVLCEMMALPYEAAEAWLAVARMDAVVPDDAEEATGRAIALETEADPDRSPQIRFASLVSALVVPAGEEGVTALDLLEDRLRHDPRCDPAAFDRGTWTTRGAVPPRSVWRIYSATDGTQAARLLATLLIFGRQTDREPEAILQGFEPDVAEARPAVEAMVGGSFAPPEGGEGMPAVGPTAWLMGAQFRLRPDDLKPAGGAADEAGLVDLVLDRQRAALWGRFLDVWPDTPLPELLGRTPRQAVGDAAGRQRVAALLTEGEATSRQRDASDAWASMRGRLGLPGSAPIVSERPLQEVPPMRWHRLDLDRLPLDQLRAVFGTALDAGFERAAERAAEAIVARGDAAPEDRWEALGLLEDRALSGRRKLEIIAELRGVAKALKAGDGMLDVAELRIRLQRGDQVETAKLLDHLRREHSRDQQVLQSLAEVLMEAGIDLTALAGRDAAAGAVPGMGGVPAAAARSPAAGTEQGRIWTPGGEQPPGGEKKAIWTPG